MHIFHAVFTRYLGGLEQSYINVTEALVSKGHTVTALLKNDAPYSDAVAAHTSDIIPLKLTGFYDVFALWKIRRLLKQERPDIIIAHNGRAITLLCMASKGLGIPVCGVSHSYKTARAMRADALVVLSEHMKKHFLEAGYKKPLTIIPNAIHLPDAPGPREWHMPVIIGAIGRFTPEKGFPDLLHALHALKKTGLAFTLKLAGDGPQLPELKALADELGLTPHIQFAGWIKDKAAFYRELDIMCMPSREDSFPMVALETLAHGVPLVATDAPGPASILIDGVNGLLVPRRDTQAMADALHRLATQSKLGIQVAKGGWQTIQDYSFPAVAERWNETLRAILMI